MTGGTGTGTPSTSAVNTDIAELRRMIAEPTTTTYSDATLTTYIEKYPLIDSYGRDPTITGWVEDYDLASAAAKIWAEKAAKLVCDYDFSADGASYSRSQSYEMFMKQAKYWSSRRAPVTLRAVTAWNFERDMQADPESVMLHDESYVINLPEPVDDDE
jgi:hypothetical protein